MTSKCSAHAESTEQKIPSGLFQFKGEQELSDYTTDKKRTCRRYEITDGNLSKLLPLAYDILKHDICYEGYKPDSISITLHPEGMHNLNEIWITIDKSNVDQAHDYIFGLANATKKMDLEISFILWTETEKYISPGQKESKSAWRKEVLKDGKCVCCGADKKLEAHHIRGKAKYPHLATDINNGVALCQWCHKKYHSYYGNDGSLADLIEFIKRFGSVNNQFDSQNLNALSQECGGS